MIAVLALAGCNSPRLSQSQLDAEYANGRVPTQPSAAEDPIPNQPDHFVHDAGEVLAGATLSHSFDFANPFAEAIWIEKDSDIHKNCGGSEVTPAKRVLRPREVTQVRVSLNTAGQHGLLYKGGEIFWTSASGAKHAIRYDIKTHARAPLEAQPAFVLFSEAEVSLAAVKETVLTANAPVDWTTLTLSSDSPQFQVLESRVDGGCARVNIRSSPSDDSDDFAGYVLARVRVHSDSPESAGEWISFAIRTQARRAVDLAVSPQILPISFDAACERGKARCLLRGQQLIQEPATVIESIGCPGYEVAWSVGSWSVKAKTALLHVDLTRLHNATTVDENDERVLSITARSGKILRMRYVVVQGGDRKQ